MTKDQRRWFYDLAAAIVAAVTRVLNLAGSVSGHQELNWCAANYLDLPIKEHRPGGKRLAANKPASPSDKQ